jgi:2-polyprenyl-3-methyl-5-hydroxy-6-metoxy-1,4-benzoquinol methylase
MMPSAETGHYEGATFEPDAAAVRNDFDAHRFSLVVELATRFGAQAGMRWLDIGCHNGTFARRLASSGFEVTGTDVWDPVLMKDSNWRYVRQQNEVIPMPDGSADVVSALEVIEHVVDTDRFLEEVHRVTSPSGLVLLTTPNINMLRNRWRVLAGRYPHGLEWKTVIHHVRLYNSEKLRSHLNEHGFDVQAVRGLHLLPTRLCRSRVMRSLSERLALMFPTLCSTLVVVASRRGSSAGARD